MTMAQISGVPLSQALVEVLAQVLVLRALTDCLGLDSAVLDSAVLDTAVLDTAVLDTAVLDSVVQVLAQDLAPSSDRLTAALDQLRQRKFNITRVCVFILAHCVRYRYGHTGASRVTSTSTRVVNGKRVVTKT